MVVPWIWYSIWKFWVIHVLVFLVFQVFSAVELISLAKTVNLAVWAFPSNFLYDFTLFVIDMHQNMPISLFKTLFDHFHFHSPAAIIWRVILKLRHMWSDASVRGSHGIILKIWKSMSNLLTDNLKARDASASKNQWKGSNGQIHCFCKGNQLRGAKNLEN